jgi:pimeloyl-ACP methyl ester carboxylesterase
VKPSIRIAAAAAAALAVVAVGTVLVVTLVSPSVDDPDTAHCDRPPVSVGAERALADHREVDVQFTCVGAVQAGTIYLPGDDGQHPALVWIHGAGQARRLPYAFDMIGQLVHAGVAVLSYDKRGVGQSQGVCCPGDAGHFNLLTADAIGAVSVLRSRPEIDPSRVGLFGASQAGWIAPRAAVEAHAAFLALASAPTVTERTANLYERLASGQQGRLSTEEISRRLEEAGSPGYDPLPDLEQLTVPGLWEFGTADTRTPVDESVAILDTLKAAGNNITVVVFPNAGHGLLDTPPTDPDAGPTMIRWILDHAQVSTGGSS